MTDRGTTALRQSTDQFTVGPSSLTWDEAAQTLIIDINEISSLPLVSRVRGQVRLKAHHISDQELALHPDGTHIWRPFSPNARIEVDLEAPGWQWEGHGYFDANFGTRALEQDFSTWTWGRFPTSAGTYCFYDIHTLDRRSFAHGLRFDHDGSIQYLEALPKMQGFSNSLWQVKRETRCDAGATPRQIKSLLDAPFYSRALVETTVNGERSEGTYESLNLHRFRNPVILSMLAVRVPRRAKWQFAS